MTAMTNPPSDPSSPTEAAATRLGRALAQKAAAHPGLSGIHALPVPGDAFGARVALADAADRTLDAQYYIWHGDETGLLLFEALWRAAQRGVKVRLLLDDNPTVGLDEIIASLDSHPNLEVRLYNPLFHRKFRPLNYVTDSRRLNRRMHNKSLTADRLATIVGGRNVGNEYFGTGGGTVFADMDVIAGGQAATDVTVAFERHWTSASAYPVASLLKAAPPGAAGALESRFREVRSSAGARAYIEQVERSSTVREIIEGRLPLEWTTARLVCDDAAKTLDRAGRKDLLLLTALLEAVGHPASSFDLVSPYFVPGTKGTDTLATLAGRGVAVRVLTNSLSATDVSAVHAGYAKRRRDLLGAGIRLFELERTAIEVERPGSRMLSGGSAASLHAKTFAVDRRRVFVGSFNFDERSAFLNTEMGLLIDSPTLAGQLASKFDAGFHGVAYEVRRREGAGGLEWIERPPTGGERRLTTEPRTSATKRALVRVLSFLPIEWLL
jgi:putative cardiolipin synthase